MQKPLPDLPPRISARCPRYRRRRFPETRRDTRAPSTSTSTRWRWRWLRCSCTRHRGRVQDSISTRYERMIPDQDRVLAVAQRLARRRTIAIKLIEGRRSRNGCCVCCTYTSPYIVSTHSCHFDLPHAYYVIITRWTQGVTWYSSSPGSNEMSRSYLRNYWERRYRSLRGCTVLRRLRGHLAAKDHRCSKLTKHTVQLSQMELSLNLSGHP